MAVKENANYKVKIEANAEDIFGLVILLNEIKGKIKLGIIKDDNQYCLGSYSFSITERKSNGNPKQKASNTSKASS
jgi:hypothetical protein